MTDIATSPSHSAQTITGHTVMRADSTLTITKFVMLKHPAEVGVLTNAYSVFWSGAANDNLKATTTLLGRLWRVLATAGADLPEVPRRHTKAFAMRVGQTNLKIFIVKDNGTWDLLACTGRIECSLGMSDIKQVWEQGDCSDHVEPEEMEVDVNLYEVNDFEV
ncbi:hypothetical protein EYR40_007892 [Pleurotus pulmonarius]|nr:hypothetical protein EYR38_007799 [Pleurotus pulmonarius]KAF4597433.1 hypothetical protein EYR40_007892 [Pleurotus pulmonarius]